MNKLTKLQEKKIFKRKNNNNARDKNILQKILQTDDVVSDYW